MNLRVLLRAALWPSVRSLSALALCCCLDAASASDPYAPKPAVPPGYTLVGGDILVRARSGPVPKSIFLRHSWDYWPGGIVPYEFDANVSPDNQTAMLAAMAQWEAVANARFVARGSQRNYVHIQNSDGNNSAVGLQGGEQIINIYNWERRYIMAHELGHCLGLGHEQSRSDRDSYVVIRTENVQPDYSDQFDVAVGYDHYGPYDFDSLMQYGQCDFSIDCAAGFDCACTHHVIDVLPPYDTLWQSKIGQRDHLSYYDALIMSFLYPEPDWRFADANFTSLLEVGTFLEPYTAFAAGEALMPTGGTLWMQPGTYSASGLHSKPMTLRAPLGAVTLE